jgi:DNA-binding transcriptional regulator LsrR (DeoR family)
LLAALSGQEREALRQHGVRADLLATLLDDDGTVVPSEVTERGIAISPEQLRQIPRVVAVAGGADKGSAVVAVARAGLITGLVADRALPGVALTATPVSANPNNRRRHNRP